MKKKIILKKVFPRDKWRIFISFNYDESLVTLVRQINGNRYSSTYKSWYADDSEETLKQILRIFRDTSDVDISALTHNPEKADSKTKENNKDNSSPDIQVELPELNPEIKDREAEIIPTRRIIEKVVERPRFSPVELRINEHDGRLAIRFTGHYDEEWIEEIKSFGKYQYDKVRKEFLVPWSVMTGDSLSDYFTSRGVEVNIVKAAPAEALKSARKEIGDEIRSRKIGEKALEGLDLMSRYLDEVRYSDRTNESYLALLELFFKYFNEKDPLTISMDEVSEFVYEFIITNGYSASYQNQMISSIKTFYRISGRSHIDLQLIERPKKSRALPKVFSKEEVKRILNATRNTKHKLLLWIIYSCGLRRSEVTNIRLNDLDRDRGILHIREGKGRVDRIVPVSQKVWEKLDEYVDGFHPGKYLFEGQTGGRYSVESVSRVFKEALKKAGINKEVGVHSLRHSYATHLHESGLDIRYIQELLGHRSTRTTEIYTHVSRRNLVAVRSPIEDMDVKKAEYGIEELGE
jgi:integrase/recombinase XerD